MGEKRRGKLKIHLSNPKTELSHCSEREEVLGSQALGLWCPTVCWLMQNTWSLSLSGLLLGIGKDQTSSYN